MTAAVEVEQLLDGIACHCAGDEHGHTPGSDGCGEAPVKSRTLRPFSDGPTASSPAVSCTDKYGRLRGVKPSGTCPECGRSGVKVTAVKRLGAPWFGKGPDPKVGHRVELGIDVRLAEHKGPGKSAAACEFTGPPAELSFTPARDHDLAAWEREHGPGSVR